VATVYPSRPRPATARAAAVRDAEQV